MTKEELAAKLNGREYGSEITPQESLEAAQNRLVVVFGASDDLVIFAGSIEEELGDGKIFLDREGLLERERDDSWDDDAMFEWLLRMRADPLEIEPEFGPGGEDISWVFRTNIPHATFLVKEDVDDFCRGIVFSLDDLPEAPRP